MYIYVYVYICIYIYISIQLCDDILKGLMIWYFELTVKNGTFPLLPSMSLPVYSSSSLLHPQDVSFILFDLAKKFAVVCNHPPSFLPSFALAVFS